MRALVLGFSPVRIQSAFAGTVSKAIQPLKFLFRAKRCSPINIKHSAALVQIESPSVQVQDYQGGRTASDIVSHAQQLLEVHGGPPTHIEELISQHIFDEKCVQRTGICIISFLPHLLDENAAQRNKRLATLVAIADSKDIKKLPVKLFWAVSVLWH